MCHFMFCLADLPHKTQCRDTEKRYRDQQQSQQKGSCVSGALAAFWKRLLPTKVTRVCDTKGWTGRCIGSSVPDPRQFKRQWNTWLEHISLSLWKPGSHGALTNGVRTVVSLVKTEDLQNGSRRERHTQVARERNKGWDKSTKWNMGMTYWILVILLDRSAQLPYLR